MAGRDGNGKWLIIGLGNADRGDDGAGIAVAQDLAVADVAATGAVVVIHEGDGLDLIELWRTAERVIVVDAVAGTIAPGGYVRFDASAQPLPAAVASGSGHSVGLAEAIEIARALSMLPNPLVVYAIGARTFTLGIGLAPAVAGACARVAGRIRQEIGAG